MIDEKSFDSLYKDNKQIGVVVSRHITFNDGGYDDVDFEFFIESGKLVVKAMQSRGGNRSDEIVVIAMSKEYAEQLRDWMNKEYPK